MSKAFPDRTQNLDLAISQVDAQIATLSQHPKPFFLDPETNVRYPTSRYLLELLELRAKLKTARQAEDEPFMVFQRRCRR